MRDLGGTASTQDAAGRPPSDAVVLFEPYYDSYRAAVAMAGAVPRFVTLEAPDWSFDVEELRRAAQGARVILVNSPHNPTGKVFSSRELEAIAEVCRGEDANRERTPDPPKGAGELAFLLVPNVPRRRADQP